jgi:hypothetical protein
MRPCSSPLPLFFSSPCAGEEQGFKSLLGKGDATIWFEAAKSLPPLTGTAPDGPLGDEELDAVERLRQVSPTTQLSIQESNTFPSNNIHLLTPSSPSSPSHSLFLTYASSLSVNPAPRVRSPLFSIPHAGGREAD